MVVYVPHGHLHCSTFAPGQMDTRLAFNVSPLLSHDLAEDSGAKQ
jgi:hypothetical protein